jgi:bis(5'-nucleosyl)-tetraphosphatase (symmetrical)
MATYAIGDVQGCFDELQQLLRDCGFRKSRDRLWFVGDLVNRGPKSLEVLRFVRDLGSRAVVVLGNHDLHLVTQFEGFEKARRGDTLEGILSARDGRELVQWLRARPLMHVEGAHAMVHAGLLPQWTVGKALRLAGEVEAALTGRDYKAFLAHMYGSKPDRWSDALEGWDRLRVIVNAMTRLRFCNAQGKMQLAAKGVDAPRGFKHWYQTRRAGRHRIVFGHWSQLGLKLTRSVAGLDSGCVWGGALSALRLDDDQLFQVRCNGYQTAGGEG